MIAKIGRSGNLYGALAYNQLKVENENGKTLFANKMIETANGHYSVTQLAQSFAPYLIALSKYRSAKSFYSPSLPIPNPTNGNGQ